MIRAKASLFDPDVYVVAEAAFDAEREDKRQLVEMAECEMSALRATIAVLRHQLAEAQKIDPDAVRFHVLCQGGVASEFFVGRYTDEPGIYEVLSGESLCEAIDAALAEKDQRSAHPSEPKGDAK